MMNKTKEAKRQRRKARQNKRIVLDPGYNFEAEKYGDTNSYVRSTKLHPRKNIQPHDVHHQFKRAAIARQQAAIDAQKKEMEEAKNVADQFKAEA